jgi:hypothetical protein
MVRAIGVEAGSGSAAAEGSGEDSSGDGVGRSDFSGAGEWVESVAESGGRAPGW